MYDVTTRDLANRRASNRKQVAHFLNSSEFIFVLFFFAIWWIFALYLAAQTVLTDKRRITKTLPPDIDGPPNPPKNMLKSSSGVISAAIWKGRWAKLIKISEPTWVNWENIYQSLRGDDEVLLNGKFRDISIRCDLVTLSTSWNILAPPLGFQSPSGWTIHLDPAGLGVQITSKPHVFLFVFLSSRLMP